MYDSGLSCREIGDVIQLTKEQVARIVTKAGKTRSRSDRVSLGLNKPHVLARMSLAAQRPQSEAAKDKLRELVGPKNANWRAGLTVCNGYIVFTNSTANGINAGRHLHQVVAEWKFGRSVNHGEHVHHVDGNKLNNDPENLDILFAEEHAIIHTPDREQGKIKHGSIREQSDFGGAAGERS